MVTALALKPSPYLVVLPGTVSELGSQINLPAEQRRETGWFAFTAARVGSVSYLGWLRAKLNPSAEILPAAALHPPGVSQSQFSTVAAAWMQQSKTVATLVALERAGYPAVVGSQGLLVEGVESGSPLEGLLQPGDVIVTIDGRPAGLASPSAQPLELELGAYLPADIIRDSQWMSVSLPLREGTTEPGWSPHGLQVSEYLLDIALPFPVEINSGDVSGDSAGLMFGLGLLDALTPGDLAGGHRVAGTGTIGLNGQVGPIGAVAEKVMAAEQQGADVFLVPSEDFAEASRAARDIDVIAVGTFDEAVAALVELGGQMVS
jgi:PDZ domain-containing protein